MPELVHNETRLLNNAAILADALELELRRVLAYACVYACLNASKMLEPHIGMSGEAKLTHQRR